MNSCGLGRFRSRAQSSRLEVIGVKLTGKLSGWTSPKDVILKVCSRAHREYPKLSYDISISTVVNLARPVSRPSELKPSHVLRNG